jgi:hypothetical protein
MLSKFGYFVLLCALGLFLWVLYTQGLYPFTDVIALQ